MKRRLSNEESIFRHLNPTENRIELLAIVVIRNSDFGDFLRPWQRFAFGSPAQCDQHLLSSQAMDEQI